MDDLLFKTVLIDPPWDERGGGKIKRGADRHYPLLKTKVIPDVILSCPEFNLVDENAHLYLWVTNNFLKDGLWVMEKIGFRYVTMLTWPKPHFGLGQYFRGQTEHMLFGVKGSFMKTRGVHSTLLPVEKTGKHSKKPGCSYDLIEGASFPNYLELFARSKREGWASWGNEV
jgi:N6-adenosine-specific RNA methylase IME4